MDWGLLVTGTVSTAALRWKWSAQISSKLQQ